LFNVQRELDASTALEVGYLGYTATVWRGCSTGTRLRLRSSVGAEPAYPEFTGGRVIGNVAEARYDSLAIKLRGGSTTA
jgi:hypothetical protein